MVDVCFSRNPTTRNIKTTKLFLKELEMNNYPGIHEQRNDVA
jgi:hypothetical protein